MNRSNFAMGSNPQLTMNALLIIGGDLKVCWLALRFTLH